MLPATVLAIMAEQAILGAVATWKPRKTAVTLAIRCVTPASIRFPPGRTRAIDGIFRAIPPIALSPLRYRGMDRRVLAVLLHERLGAAVDVDIEDHGRSLQQPCHLVRLMTKVTPTKLKCLRLTVFNRGIGARPHELDFVL